MVASTYNLNSLLSFVLLLTSTGASNSVVSREERQLSDVVEWATSNGGWMSHKVEIRPIGTEGLSGIFAKEALAQGEVVVDIPWDLILRPPRANSTWCEKVETVRTAITKQRQTPYERYLVSRTKHTTPFYWSKVGKELLGELMYRFHFTGFMGNQVQQFANLCQATIDQSYVDAMTLLDTRGEGEQIDLLVPIGDLLNHRVSAG